MNSELKGVLFAKTDEMDYLFNDLKEHEDKTIFVIGNGFDLFHGLPSSYGHFWHCLIGKGKEKFVSEMESIFSKKLNNEFLLWKDFEEALGEFNIDELFLYYTEGIDRVNDERTRTVAQEKIHSTTSDIVPLLKDWASEIEVNNIKKQLPLTLQSKYLTFNYTQTLESVYGISPDNICHIHGKFSDSSIVVGHYSYVDKQTIEDSGYGFYEEEAKKGIADEMNNLRKDTMSIANNHQNFFDGIKGFDRVVILGHSLSEVDDLYLGKIRGKVNDNAHWHIAKHCPEDEERISKFIKSKGITENNRWIFNF